jgi:hypothetical protein
MQHAERANATAHKSLGTEPVKNLDGIMANTSIWEWEKVIL